MNNYIKIMPIYNGKVNGTNLIYWYNVLFVKYTLWRNTLYGGMKVGKQK